MTTIHRRRLIAATATTLCATALLPGLVLAQKKIVLGEKGQTIKAIGAASRKEIGDILEQKVHLFLFVKVRENWSDDPERYREMGLDFPG